MKTIKILLISMIFALFAASAYAKAFPYAGDITAGINGADDNWDSYIDFMLPLAAKETSFLFLAPRASMTGKSLFGSDANEFSIGTGYRQYLDKYFKGGVILGINAYYDTRNTELGNSYQQAGAGLEFLSEYLDFRANAYIPFGHGETYLGKYYDIPTQHHIAATYYYESSMKGMDSEVGVKLPVPDWAGELRVYGGYYYFTAEKSEDVKGFKGRAEYRPFNIVRLNYALYETDSFNGSSWQAGADIKIPFDFRNFLRGKSPFAGLWKYIKTKPLPLKNRIGEMVMRDMYVRARQSGVIHNEDRLLSDSGNEFYFTVVSPSGAGDGTFENPASLDSGLSLNKAVTGDNASLLLLGGSYSLDTTLDLSGHQSGEVYVLGPAEITYRGGNLSKITNGNPVIQSSGITAFAVDGSVPAPQFFMLSSIEFKGKNQSGTGFEISSYNSGLYINNNSFANFEKGLLVENSSKTVSLYNNMFEFNATGAEAAFGSALFEQNIFNDNIVQGVLLNNSTGAVIVSNLIENNATGVNIQGGANSYLYDNVISNNAAYGVSSSSSYYMVISENYIETNQGGGVYSSSDTGIEIFRNRVWQNSGNGMDIYDSASAKVLNNYIAENEVNGLYMLNSDSAEVQSNTSVSNGANGIYIENSTAPVFLRNASLYNKDDGMAFINTSYGDISENQSSGNTLNGIYYGSGAYTNIGDNLVSENKTGLFVTNSSLLTVSTNTAHANDEGMKFISSTVLTVKANTVSSNTAYGIYAAGANDSTLLSNTAYYNEGVGGIFVEEASNVILSSNETYYNTNSGITVTNVTGANLIYNGANNDEKGHGITLINVANAAFYWNSFVGKETGHDKFDLYLLGTTSFNPATSGSNKFFNDNGNPNYYAGDIAPVDNYENNVKATDFFD